jgi:hypothetical protein
LVCCFQLQIQPTDQYRGDFEAGNSKPNAWNDSGSNGNSGCCPPQVNPEINIQMKSSAIVAKTRKLKAVGLLFPASNPTN